MNWLLYGANGYTGELIAREAVRRGMRPVLAGRNAAAIEPLARELGCEARVFDLSHPELAGMRLVLHCAGPFRVTSPPMVDACLAAGVDYVDITGEIAVFEALHARHDEAMRAGVLLLPGAGFDVVPTDCLARMLADRLPGATELVLAFYSPRARVSRGTLKTMLDGLGEGGAIRREGRIVRVPMAFDVRTIPFPSGPRLAMTIPWGDVSTAYHTTAIPNIRVYNAASPKAIARVKRLQPLLPLFRLRPVQAILQPLASRQEGPSAEARATGRTELWGSASDGRKTIERTLTTPEGYAFTVLSALEIVGRVLREARTPGVFTPAKRFGAELVLSIPGVVQ